MEIERKFLIKNRNWAKASIERVFKITQQYIHVDDKIELRVRQSGGAATLTMKSKGTGTREEVESTIEYVVATQMMEKFGIMNKIQKTRFWIFHDGLRWELDEFTDLNLGLITVEVELDSIDQKISIPDWVGEEVTEDKRYYNSELANKPFTTWDNK